MRRPLPVLDSGATLAPGYGDRARPRLGFFTDTSLCIGCKACEVACKEWNDVPEDGYVFTGHSYDNTAMLSANSWRHVAFIEQDKPLRLRRDGAADGGLDLVREWVPVGPAPSSPDAEPAVIDLSPPDATGMRWLMASDVCKHCTQAACLDVCPTGALFRTEFGSVVVQQEVCNGCGYCISACPFGVIDRREIAGAPGVGVAQKCTLCYDRAHDNLEPACAKACPTKSIQWGELTELREHAAERLEQLEGEGYVGAQLYGHDPRDGVGGFGAFFLLLDEPEVYGLPPDPRATTRDLPSIWGHALVAAGALAGILVAAALGGRKR